MPQIIKQSHLRAKIRKLLNKTYALDNMAQLDSCDNTITHRVIRINVRLQGETAERFQRVKKYLGTQSDSEVVRFLINEYYRQNVRGRDP